MGIDRSDGERARRVDGEGAKKTIAIGLGIRTATIDPKGGLVKRHLVLMSGGLGMTSPRIDEGEMKKTNVSIAQKKGMTKRTCDMEWMLTSNGLTARSKRPRVELPMAQFNPAGPAGGSSSAKDVAAVQMKIQAWKASLKGKAAKIPEELQREVASVMGSASLGR